jgi:DNA-binding response OmpR family regulator
MLEVYKKIVGKLLEKLCYTPDMMILMEKSFKVLLVEDESALALVVQKLLNHFGCQQVWLCDSAACAVEIASKESIDLVFMDLNIKGAVDGISCAQELAKINPEVMIVYASSFSDEETLDRAIDMNTLNYLVKPYGKKEIEITLLLAKIALKKRALQTQKSYDVAMVELGNEYVVDLHQKRLLHSGIEVMLSKIEHRLLMLLSSHANQTVSNSLIYEEVWQGKSISATTLREAFTRVRKRLKGSLVKIEAVQGVGYRLLTPQVSS